MPREDDLALSPTQSLCPECLARIPAVRLARGGDVYMKKTCPEHGEFRVVLWRGTPSYQAWMRSKVPSYPRRPATSVGAGCPFDCGLCPDHRQQTCTALLEVTQRCNLRCTVCFADSNSSRTADADMATIRGWYEALLETQRFCNIQLSGGEPTVRDDLVDIVALGRSVGFGFIQVNTNGLRLGAEPAYAEKLKKAGLSSVFLQFDGTEEDIHRALRGGPFLKQKTAAIENCREHEIGVVLVPTVVPGVNDHNLGSIVQFALENLDVVRGVHFQPVSYFGRYPSQPSDADRITIPEVLRKLEEQTHGLVVSQDFRPPGCENALCSFHGNFVLMPDGSLKSLTPPYSCDCSTTCVDAAQGASDARKFVARNWSTRDNKTSPNAQRDFSMGEWDVLLQRVATHKICISGMAFQDVWNIDLDRLRDCCIHVAAREKRLIPFCIFNLTNATGRRLYAEGKFYEEAPSRE